MESSSDHVSCAKFGKIHASNSILNSISRVTSLKRMHALTNPQIQRVTFSYRTPCVVTKVRFSSVIFFDFKRGKFRHRCPNSVIGTWTTSSTSLNHDHRTTPALVTPEADLISTLQVTTAWSLSEALSCQVLSSIFNFAFSKALTLRPDWTVSEVAIASNFGAECLPTQTVPCGLQ